ncbi:MAG: hypothetical protein R3Y62_03415 [Eubacteriales bacterium]
MKQNHLFLKILAGALGATLLLGMASMATGADSTSDPLVTLSYLTGTFKDSLMGDVEDMVEDKADDMESQIKTQATALEKSMDSQDTTIVSNDFSRKTVASGGTIAVDVGDEILWLYGTATINVSCLSDTTAGTTLSATSALSDNHLYIATGSGTITATADCAYLLKS